MCAKRSGECVHSGASFIRGSHRAFPGPQTKHGRRVRPLSSPVIGKRALEERVARIGTAARGRVVRSARPHGRLARCDCPSPPPAKLNERRRSETIHFCISNLRNRLRPQAPSGNRYQPSGTARTVDTNLAHALGWCDSRCPPVHLSERRHSETLSFHISNLRNRLRPQARAVNQPRANKE